MKRLKIKRLAINDMLWKRRYEASKKIGIHPNTLSRRMRGEGDWTFGEINRLADYLEVDVDQLVEIDREGAT